MENQINIKHLSSSAIIKFLQGHDEQIDTLITCKPENMSLICTDQELYEALVYLNIESHKRKEEHNAQTTTNVNIPENFPNKTQTTQETPIKHFDEFSLPRLIKFLEAVDIVSSVFEQAKPKHIMTPERIDYLHKTLQGEEYGKNNRN